MIALKVQALPTSTPLISYYIYLILSLHVSKAKTVLGHYIPGAIFIYMTERQHHEEMCRVGS
ncbi:uncharacterized protein DS421_15g501260 [Arachis hypogaea]|nr:uncharacterized protein DS421_15g501260 [Arachis hypogaea]